MNRRPFSLTAIVLFLNIGVLVGLIWAYIFAPPVYTNLTPNMLGDKARDQWLKMVAFSHYAGAYDDYTSLYLLHEVEQPAKSIERLLQTAPRNSVEQVALQNIYDLAIQAGNGTLAPTNQQIVQNVVLSLVPMVLLTALALGVYALAFRLRRP